MKQLLFVVAGLVFLIGVSNSAPAQTPGGYTLEQVYYYLTEGTGATWGEHSLEPLPGAVPGQDSEGFRKSLDDIYTDLKILFDQCSTYDQIAPNLEEGYYFFCTDTNYWGLREGTIEPPPSQGGEWVLVPGDAGIGTDDFYVMKYEAKNVSGAYSQADTAPYVNINLANSKAACEALGAGYHLMTVNEAQTINRNLEQVESNWYGEVVGTNGLFRGNCGRADNLGYNGSDPEYGTGRDSKAKLTLSNSNEIWDWSGNVWEWIDGGGSNGTIGTSGGVTWRSASGWIEWDNADLDGSPGERSVLGPSDSSWTSTQGMGQYFGDASTNAFVRGGNWRDEGFDGVFALNLDFAPTYTGTYVGFRCCK